MREALVGEVLDERAGSSRGRQQHRGVKRLKSRYPRKHRGPAPPYDPQPVIVEPLK